MSVDSASDNISESDRKDDETRLILEANASLIPKNRNRKPITEKSKKKGRPKKEKKELSVIKKRVNGYKYDWDSLRQMFIEGIQNKSENPLEREFVTLKELGIRTNTTYAALRERSSAESWQENREAFQMRLMKHRQYIRLATLGKESIEFDTKTLNMAKAGVNIIMTRLAEIINEINAAKVRKDRAIELSKQGVLVDPYHLQSVIDSKELAALAAAAQLWQSIGNKSIGTDVIKGELTPSEDLDTDVRAISMSQELGRDDPERLAAFMLAAKRAGLGDFFEADIVEDAEVILTQLQQTEESGKENA